MIRISAVVVAWLCWWMLPIQAKDAWAHTLWNPHPKETLWFAKQTMSCCVSKCPKDPFRHIGELRCRSLDIQYERSSHMYTPGLMVVLVQVWIWKLSHFLVHITSCEHLLADSQFMFCRWSQSHSCFGGQRCWCQCTRWFWPRGEVMPSPLVVPIQGLCRLEG